MPKPFSKAMRSACSSSSVISPRDCWSSQISKASANRSFTKAVSRSPARSASCKRSTMVAYCTVKTPPFSRVAVAPLLLPGTGRAGKMAETRPFLVTIGREFCPPALVSIRVGLLRLISPRPASKQCMAFGDLFLNCCGRFRGALEDHPLFNGADSLVHLALRDKRGGRPRCDRVLTSQKPDFGIVIWELRHLVRDTILLIRERT